MSKITCVYKDDTGSEHWVGIVGVFIDNGRVPRIGGMYLDNLTIAQVERLIQNLKVAVRFAKSKNRKTRAARGEK